MRTRECSIALNTNSLCSRLRWPWRFAFKLRGCVGRIGAQSMLSYTARDLGHRLVGSCNASEAAENEVRVASMIRGVPILSDRREFDVLKRWYIPPTTFLIT
jgi:hypothetical protein